MRGRPGTETDDAGAPEELRSRGDLRREQKREEEQLMQLATALIELGDRMLAKMSLPEDVLDLVVGARAVKEPAPKHRALRLVRVALRGTDAAAIQRKLRDLHEQPRTIAADGDLEQWRARLLSGGEDVLTEFLTAFPAADRRQLRQLLRNTRTAPETTRAESLRTLTKVLGAHVG